MYSFRHSGAVEIFKRTGSITKLQKATRHSSINVSLTYLRGLEIAELKEEDMPKFNYLAFILSLNKKAINPIKAKDIKKIQTLSVNIVSKGFLKLTFLKSLR